MSNILTNNINPRSGNLITIGGANDRVSIAGTLSYEDVANIDSVGIVTARGGLNVGPLTGIAFTVTSAGAVFTSSNVRVGGDAIGGLKNGSVILSNSGFLAASDNAAVPLWRGYTTGNITPTSEIETSGDAYFLGRVGIGTDNPVQALYVRNSTSSQYTAIAADTYAAIGGGVFDAMQNGVRKGVFGVSGWLNSNTDDDPMIYTVSGKNLRFYIGGTTERMRIDSSGNVNFPGTDPIITSGFNMYLQVPNNIEITGDSDNSGSGYIDFRIGSGSKARIDSSGRLLVGATSGTGGSSGQYAKLQVQGSTSNNAGGGIFSINIGNDGTSLVNNNYVGGIYFATTGTGEFASIESRADGTCGAADYPGRLLFSTTSDAASIPTERMRIDSTGNIGINNTNPQAKLNVSGNTLVNSQIILVQNTGAGGGPSAPSAGIAVTSYAHNNATAAYGIDIFAQHGIGQDCYGLRAIANQSSSSTAGIGVLGHAHVNSGATNHSPSLPSGGVVAGVYGYATNYGSSSIAQSSAVIGWNNCTFGGLAYGGYFRTTAGPTTIIPLLVNHNGTDRMKISSVGEASFYSDITAVAARTGASASGSSEIIYCARNATGTGSGTGVFAVYSNGTYSTLSDQTQKKNIETTRNGYLEDLNRLRVVKYNWNEQQDDEPKELGLIAQEVEQVFPGLISEMKAEDDQSNKGIKVGVLPFMLLKALQEAVTRIETLEQRLTDAGL